MDPEFQTVSAATAAKRFGRIINAALAGVITFVQRYEETVVVILSYEEYRRLEDQARLGREIQEEQERGRQGE